MFSLFQDPLIDDVFTRAEQSRVSYNLQTEEFRSLNANLQTYLGDIKIIDDNNHQLQENIEEIRGKYFLTLENHLKRLPNDFREQSEILTTAHLQRYQFKSRTRRLNSEREELKRRIQFLATSEKGQSKHLNLLQKQERTVRNEFVQLNEQYQRLVKYVDSEKQLHRQAMEKVDDFQHQLEQICVERSKTEFEIQTLKEEVKLMQTTKEFLNEERETIISTQTEANEYLLSRLNESITRIREDFHQLNQTQLQQIENDYKQIFQTLEETQQTTNTSPHIIPSEHERLQDEHQIVLQEFTTLNDHNQILSARVLAMEDDLYALRNERMQQLISKDNELEHSKLELQTLNEKLTHLAEYDRNLKFELTLYRGVLESEHRRKQSATLIRPTTLRTNKTNSSTDRTTWLTNSTNQNKFYDQQKEEILTTRNRVQSDYDPLGEDTNVQTNDVVETETSSTEEILISGDTLWRQLIEPFNQEQKQDKMNADVIAQNTGKPLSSISTAVSIEDQSTSPFEVQPLSSAPSVSVGIRKSPTSSTSPILREDQSPSSYVRRLPATPPELRSSPTITSPKQTTAATNMNPFAFEPPPSSPTFPSEHQTLSEVQQSSSRTSSITAGKSSEVQQSPTSSIAPTVPEDQLTSSQVYRPPSTPPQEHQPSSRTSSTTSKTSLDLQKSSAATAVTVPEYKSSTADVRQLPSTPSQEDQPSSRTSSISAKTSSEIQNSLATAPVFPENQPLTSEVRQSPSTPPEEDQPLSRTSSTTSKTSLDLQRSPPIATTSTVPEYQSSTADVRQLPSTPSQEDQPLSRTFSTTSKTSFDLQRSPPIATTSTVPECQPVTSDAGQLPSTPSQEDQPSSRTSSISAKTSSEIQNSLATTPIFPEHQPLTSEVRQSPSTPPQEHQPSSRTSSTTSKTSLDLQKSPPIATTSTISEYQPVISDVRQSPSTPPEEHQSLFERQQSLSRTSSISAKASSDIEKSLDATPLSPEYQPLTVDVHQSPSTPPEDHQALLEIEKSSRTSDDVQGKPSSTTAEGYEIPASTDEFDNEYQYPKSFIETDDNLQYEDSILYTTEEKATSEVDPDERRQSIHSNEPSSLEEFQVPFQTKPNKLRSSAFAITSTPDEDTNESPPQSDTNLSSHKDNKSDLEPNETSYQMEREEDMSSSLRNQPEEDHSIPHISSGITSDDNLHELNIFLPQDTTKQSSGDTSFADVEEMDLSTSQKLETKSDDNDDPNLARIMQDLRYVFHQLANDEDLVAINNDLPEKILDRLEFRDHFIRTLFDSLIRKRLIQPAIQADRPETLDWVEFRDILFPIITGRYTERHIRKLFDLFDTSRDGYLSLQEISELLEVFHANDTIDLAQNIIDEYDTDHDGKLSVDELIEAIKQTDDINEHALSEETENEQWFNQSPTENQTITLEVPIINFASKINEKFTREMTLLGRIFEKIGANANSKLLDSNQKNLSIQLTNELINNNINIFDDDLQFFIQLFLEKKQNTDPFIDWIEFRDIFFPIINNGFYSKIDIKRWFDIFDTNENGVITQEQIIQLLRLLQIQNIEEIISKLNEITDYTDSWTLGELIFALDTVEETASHLLTNTEQISSFDINWLSNNIF